MKLSPEFTSKFADCAKAVLQAPEDFKTKAETLPVFKQMKHLAAEGNPIAQFYLAQAYPAKSSQYRKWMQASADQGFTNAMLALVQVYAENDKVTEIQQAANYVLKILSSNDSYIKDEIKSLMKSNHLLDAEVARQMSSVSKSGVGFFAQDAKNAEFHEADLQEGLKHQR